MLLNSTTHFISELSWPGEGFRETPVVGILFGLGLVWFGFPYLEQAFQ
jgi:hypothetical protein